MKVRILSEYYEVFLPSKSSKNVIQTHKTIKVKYYLPFFQLEIYFIGIFIHVLIVQEAKVDHNFWTTLGNFNYSAK